MLTETFKVCLVGKCGSGKTWLVYQLLDCNNVSSILPTCGCEVHHVVFTSYNNTTKCAIVWDISGKEQPNNAYMDSCNIIIYVFRGKLDLKDYARYYSNTSEERIIILGIDVEEEPIVPYIRYNKDKPFAVLHACDYLR